jgi:ABC-type branched-subunit amino acid transport system substrate-binding protein
VVKIGLVAPFEGRYRAIGYEAIYAARLAIREINRAGGVRGLRVELVALNDDGDAAMAAEQARKLAIDPQVVAVIGHYRSEPTAAALAVYCEQALTLLAVALSDTSECPEIFSLNTVGVELPSIDAGSFVYNASVPAPDALPEANAFVATYNALPIDGTRAGPIALQTYDAMYLLFDALSRGATRRDMPQAIAATKFIGLGGVYRFEDGQRVDVPTYLFKYPDVELIDSTP